jgi:hypothetical protein
VIDKQFPVLSRPQWLAVNAITFVFWLATSIVAIYEIYLARQIFFSIYSRFGGDYRTGEVLGFVMIFFLVGIGLAGIVGGGEYHRKYLGQQKSVRLFAVTLGAELAIAALYHFL